MPPLLRILAYFACFGLLFAVGRYVFPAPASMLAPEDAKTGRAAALRDFWTDTAGRTLTADSPAGQVTAMLDLMDRLKPEDFPLVADLARNFPVPASILAAQWAEADAPGFFKYLASRGLKQPGDHAMAGILMNTWALSDLNAAQAAAARLQTADAPVDMELAIALALLRQDVRKGIEFVRQQNLEIPPALMRQELEIDQPDSPRWKMATPEARLDFLESLPPSEWRDTALDTLYTTWVAENPKAVLLAAQESGRGAGQIDAAITAWLEREPEALVPFFQKEARDQVKAAIGVVLARRGAEKDPQNAWDFAQWNLAGRPRAEAYRGIIEKVAATDPLFAWSAWIGEAVDEPWRCQSLQIIARALFTRDAAAAESWFASLQPPDQRTAALAWIADPAYPDNQRTALKAKFNVE